MLLPGGGYSSLVEAIPAWWMLLPGGGYSSLVEANVTFNFY
jgi:hypothetical protein